MYKNILVALSLEHGYSERSLAIAKRLLSEGGKITALHVHAQPSGTVGAYLDEEVVALAFARAREMLEARLQGVEDVTPVLLKGHPGVTIAEHANDIDADLIVIGSHKPGLRDYFLGSTAARTVRFARCAVHVLRDL